ncbi:MAG: hypothetical protein K2O91_08980 [Lachnospiraceae bacterium]|nr:hypothetical protein [Lachnospiraceae bacterium]
MYNREQLNEFAKEFMAPRLERNIKKLQQSIARDGEGIKRDLLSCMDNLFKKCICQQEADKQPIRYVHFFYLRLSVLIQQYDIQVNAFSEQSYMDDVETMVLWNPDFIMRYYEEDMEMICQEAKKQILRFGYPQLMELRERSFAIYAMLTGQYLMSVSGDIAGLESFHEMKKTDDIQIIFGGYMDKGIQIWPLPAQEGAKQSLW